VQDTATADMMRSGAASPFWQVMKEHAPSALSRYIPVVAAYFSDDEGRLLALPFNISTPVLYFNRDAFREAKLDVSKIPSSWYGMPSVLGRLLESGRPCALTTT
jgi:sn-glycerol 3-phosphate transport system substrate-binding protein